MPRLKKKWTAPVEIPAPSGAPSVTPEYLDVPAAAKYLSVTTWTIRRLMKFGDLPFSQIGKRFIVRREDLAIVWAKKRAVTPIDSPRMESKAA